MRTSSLPLWLAAAPGGGMSRPCFCASRSQPSTAVRAAAAASARATWLSRALVANLVVLALVAVIAIVLLLVAWSD